MANSLALSLTAGTAEYVEGKLSSSVVVVKSATSNAVDINVGSSAAQNFVLEPGERFAWELRAGDRLYFDAASGTATLYVLASNELNNG